ncbi:uncharacterized protein LOC133848051 isoform X1 [Drosophila sulfurigaster albostrigata]|uniref:uncharacterized protein LOC133848051 isoform X1 n=1 Tax=Drosophila sulfurigaster albostrigata TaxID=89887 RepID=UPI002D218500|nr:uncharacterized protein LOC133848051 isoform X1 [Drosophila sulfurigaster albostrigata]XP_062139404.1 uncharacterized protein LOC133848051 isoform X1 [Drosophila sulfurigaster albostrigata]XP_062139405.1 uncharacterized protein LOC133848051 isoform X1 [Drosophila sulfurigaster albostrigata]
MSARKPATVAISTTSAAAKSDNNNVATSPTLELEGTVSGGDESATGGTSATTTAASDGEVETTTPEEEVEQGPTEKEKDKETTPEATVKDSGSPRKSLTDTKILRNTRLSSPLLLGAASDGEDQQPSNSQNNQRKGSTDRQIIRGRKSIKEMREAKLQDELNVKEELANFELEDEAKDTKDNVKSVLDSKDKEKETTPTPTTATSTPTPTPVSTPATTCNRVTRKAHAQELANNMAANNNTRVTRNRRQSSTVNNEPQLPARGRRKKPALLKRKRSIDDASNESSLALKYTKVEVKEEDDDPDSSVASLAGDEVAVTPAKFSSSSSGSSSTLNIKLELPDTEDTPMHTPELPSPAVQQSTASRRGRGRPQTRTTPVSCTGSSTRATRHSKAGSPCLLLATTPTEPPTASKRRRVGSLNRSLLVAKPTSSSSGNAGVDEDSKDSLASSSMDDLLLATAEIKQEKMTMDFEESLDAGVTTKPTDPEPVEEAPPSTSAAACSNGIEPLTVDTDPVAIKASPANELVEQQTAVEGTVKDLATGQETEIEAGETASANENETEAGKAPSLSPEMISEGVSAISVKQFYKKPEFLANNLGIEKDPELGEIVQIVTETTVDAEAETGAEADVEVEADAEAQIETLAETELILELDGDAESKQDNSAYSSAAMDELRVDESGDETTEILDDQKTTDEQETTAEKKATTTAAGEEEDATAAAVAVAVAAETMSSPGELNGETEQASKADDYDDFESEIMEQLAKEGVLDASGNALSATKASTLDKPTTPPCDSIKIVQQAEDTEAEAVVKDKQEEEEVEKEKQLPPTEEEVAKKKPSQVELDLEVAPYTEEQEAEANAEADADDDADGESDGDAEMQILSEDCVEYPEENKENVSTAAADGIVVAAGGDAVNCESSIDMDIDLAFKSEDSAVAAKLEAEAEVEGKEEVKPKMVDEAKKSIDEHKIVTKMETNGDGDGDDELLRREKELHLQHLGLLTHQAAEQLRQEYIQEAHTRAVHQQQQQQHHPSGKRSAAKGNAHIESSGTLKTVIKLNRSSNGGSGGAAAVPTGTVIHGAAVGGAGNASVSGGAAPTTSGIGSATRKGGIVVGGGHAGAASSSAHGVRRQSLKMTFQKGRARGHGATDRAADGQHGAHAEDYYTIQNENEGASKSNANPNLGNAGRKTTNRLSSTNNNHHNNNNNQNHSNGNNKQQLQQQHQQHLQHSKHNNDSSHSEGQGGQLDHSFYQTVKKDEKEKILIPEKASSFKFHPGRLCEDQCYYCSGKFGLYDTPCHVGQIKSVERQQKILANEEKLTVDNCLCDACFRHVDRRANAPSYKKRISAPGHLESNSNNNNNSAAAGGNSLDKHFAGDATDADFATTSSGAASASARVCAVKDCADGASHSLRRKCVRKSVKKCLLIFEIPVGTSNVWLCEPHYNTVIQSSGCVLCKRRLGKNHMYHITSQDTDRLEKALAEMGIPVQLGVGTAVCKLCRYFANLLMKPPDSTKSQKADFVKNYRKRLLKVHNLQDGSNEVSEADDEDVRASTNSTVAVATASAASSAAGCDEASTELPMVVDYDGPATDSNSSSSSSHGAVAAAASATSKQMSKLQAILQQNLAGETATTNVASSGGGGGGVGKDKAADISNVLRGNPNISMRELFHGEEELGVQFKVPFGCSSSQRTPEGWTRVQTFLQYDEPTRRLWEELQKPYGNQSSFLRHLILLEKYYRNGDLVLAPHASPNASVYTQTVRQRLNSYDHGHCGGLQNNAKSAADVAAGQSQSPPTATAGSSNLSSSSCAASTNAASVLASALITPQQQQSQNQSSVDSLLLQPPSQEAVIPLVELNDDDDDDDDDDDGGGGGGGGGVNNGNQNREDIDYTPLERLRNVSVDKLTKQLSSNAVTITARPKESGKQASSAVEETTAHKMPLSKDAPPLVPTSSAAAAAAAAANSRSILKTNLLNKAVELLPLSAAQQQLQQQQQHQSNHKPAANANNNEKPLKLLDVANQLARSHLEQQSVSLLTLQQQQQQQQQKQKPLAAAAAVLQQPSKPAATNVAQLLSSPPELISLQRRRTSGVAIATSVNSAAAAAAAAAAAIASVPGLAGKRLQLPRAGGGSGAANAPSVIMLPDSLSPQERHDSKSWKPTLIPLKEQHKVPNKSPTLFQTADGRRLPAQVQVQSGGKPYLISIIDYNRMCILRREKLMRDQMLKTNAKSKPGGGGQAQSQSQSQSQQQQQQHSSNFAGLSSKMAAAQQTARQQLQQLQQQQQQHKQQLPTLQPGGSSGLRLARLAPKPMPPLSNPQQNATTTSNSGSNSTTTTQATNYQPMLVNALAAAAAAAATGSSSGLDNNTSWLWKNYPDHSQFLLNGNGNGAGNASKLPHLTSKPTATSISGGGSGLGGSGSGGGGITFTLKQQQQQQQQQKLIDNVIMSKIPKSLTVIPQHMGGGGGGGGDLTGSGSKE